MRTRGLVLVAPLVGVAFALAGCGGGGKSSTGGVAGTTATLAGRHVGVTESEYHIQLSTPSLAPGRTTFVAMNKGKVAHSLEIDGPGVSDKRVVGTIAPGSSKAITVTLRKGRYEIYCPVDGHKQLGMDVHVSVGGAAAGMSGGGTATTNTGTTSTSGSGY